MYQLIAIRPIQEYKFNRHDLTAYDKTGEPAVILNGDEVHLYSTETGWVKGYGFSINYEPPRFRYGSNQDIVNPTHWIKLPKLENSKKDTKTLMDTAN
jgi:hypothetical protein